MEVVVKNINDDPDDDDHYSNNDNVFTRSLVHMVKVKTLEKDFSAFQTIASSIFG